MSTSRSNPTGFAGKSVLVVGVGGLGCPAALALAGSGIGRLVLADDDLVEASNLHRQILFSDDDVGLDKLDSAWTALSRVAPSQTRIELVRSRFLPDNARDLARSVDLVIEGADNYATKFLVADACSVEKRAVVHGSAVRWRATAWAVGPAGKPCYRCLFEDVPAGEAQENCAVAGVMGPVAGLAGAMMADLTLRMLEGDAAASGVVHTYEGLSDRLRAVAVGPRSDCPLCSPNRTIFDIDEARYLGRSCAA
jgi:adenylyltransferase/sulfurtransferase